MSFCAILDQVLEVFELTYMGGNPIFTIDWKSQAHLTFYRPQQLTSPLFKIYGSVSDRPCEANESALIRALTFFDEVLGWTMFHI